MFGEQFVQELCRLSNKMENFLELSICCCALGISKREGGCIVDRM